MKQRKVQTKRVISLFLTMVMLLGVLSTGVFTIGVSATETYNGKEIVSIQSYSSSNKDVAYSIATADDLVAFGTAINSTECYGQTFILTADITLNEGWTASAEAPTQTWNHAVSAGKWFGGVFDGQGYTISGLYVNALSADGLGMFSGFKSGPDTGTQYEVVVKNFSLVNSYFKDTGAKNGDGIGAIAGDIRKNTIATVENVYVGSDVTVVKAGENVGGIIGLQCGADTRAKLTISNCVFAGSATGTHTVGGILGYANNSNGQIIINNCVNTGIVEATSSSADKLGGIIGAYYNASGSIENCINLGSLTITGGEGNNGDILGFIDTKVTNTNLKLKNCYYTNGLGREGEDSPRGVGANCTYFAGTTTYVEKSAYETAFTAAAAGSTLQALALNGGLKSVLETAFKALDIVDIKYQLSSDSKSMRFVGVVKLAQGALGDYDKLGFNISMTYNGTTYETNVTTDTVYESIMVEGTSTPASTYGGTYFFVVEVNGLDSAASDVAFEVSTVTVAAGETAENVRGFTVSCTYTVSSGS